MIKGWSGVMGALVSSPSETKKAKKLSIRKKKKEEKMNYLAIVLVSESV